MRYRSKLPYGDVDAAESNGFRLAKRSLYYEACEESGGWSAAVVLLRGFGRLDVFPPTDSGASLSMKVLSSNPRIDESTVLESLDGVRGMLYFHLLLGRLHGMSSPTIGVETSMSAKSEILRANAEPEDIAIFSAFVLSATFWLLLTTAIGLLMSFKFPYPDWAANPLLSFGRLRAIHTNGTFYGWASIALVGATMYVAARTSGIAIVGKRFAWLALLCFNAAAIFGTITLDLGINYGDQEYREWVWWVKLIFLAGVFLSGLVVVRTVAERAEREIYISNWYTIGGFVFTLILSIVAIIPTYQIGLGQVAVQAFFMHNAVGMWFTFLALGVTYYALPKLLNRPIYSYALGVLGFWTNLIFYPIIGAHHFEFSPLPWWFQTLAIVFSVGMLVPVWAGSANFFLTMRGYWEAIRRSYALPFIVVGVVLLLPRFESRHDRSVSQLADDLAFHQLHNRPLACDDVRIHHVYCLGRHLRAPPTRNRKATQRAGRRASFLARDDRSDVLRDRALRGRHAPRSDMGRGQPVHRLGRCGSTVLGRTCGRWLDDVSRAHRLCLQRVRHDVGTNKREFEIRTIGASRCVTHESRHEQRLVARLCICRRVRRAGYRNRRDSGCRAFADCADARNAATHTRAGAWAVGVRQRGLRVLSHPKRTPARPGSSLWQTVGRR